MALRLQIGNTSKEPVQEALRHDNARIPTTAYIVQKRHRPKRREFLPATHTGTFPRIKMIPTLAVEIGMNCYTFDRQTPALFWTALFCVKLGGATSPLPAPPTRNRTKRQNQTIRKNSTIPQSDFYFSWGLSPEDP